MSEIKYEVIRVRCTKGTKRLFYQTYYDMRKKDENIHNLEDFIKVLISPKPVPIRSL